MLSTSRFQAPAEASAPAPRLTMHEEYMDAEQSQCFMRQWDTFITHWTKFREQSDAIRATLPALAFDRQVTESSAIMAMLRSTRGTKVEGQQCFTKVEGNQIV